MIQLAAAAETDEEKTGQTLPIASAVAIAQLKAQIPIWIASHPEL